MANMAYCRFETTVVDLADCIAHLDDASLSASEERERTRMISLCMEVVQRYIDLKDPETCPVCQAAL